MLHAIRQREQHKEDECQSEDVRQRGAVAATEVLRHLCTVGKTRSSAMAPKHTSTLARIYQCLHVPPNGALVCAKYLQLVRKEETNRNKQTSGKTQWVLR